MLLYCFSFNTNKVANKMEGTTGTTSRLSLETCQNSIRQCLNGNVSLQTLMSAIISSFGTDKQSGISMSQSELESILELLLTKDGKDMAVAVSSDQSFIEQGLFFEYHTDSGKGYIVDSEGNKMCLN